MSANHPIIAITGSSGSGISTAQNAFVEIFLQEGINAAFVHGNGFRRYTPEEVEVVFTEAAKQGRPISHFGPESNYFDRLENLFKEYARSGTGLKREYIDNREKALLYQLEVGTYTAWQELPKNSDLLFYEGQHGACIEETWSRREMSPSHNPIVVNERHNLETKQDSGVDIARWVDLLIGVVPNINLEWIQKIHSDYHGIGRSVEDTVLTITRRMPDFVRYITPQFSLTDVNFQRIPLVDTSNPFIAREVPTLDESMLVIRFREPKKVDVTYFVKKLANSFLSRPNTIVVPGGEMQNAINVVCTPLVQELMEKKRQKQQV